MLAPFSTRYWTASTLPEATAQWSAVSPVCAQASQGKRQPQDLCSSDHARCSWPRCWHPSPPGTGRHPHCRSDLQTGAACFHPAHKQVSVAQPPRQHLHATLRTPDTHFVTDLDVGAVVDELTQLEHVTSLGSFNKLFDVGSLLTKVSDNVRIATLSCCIERRDSILSTSHSQVGGNAMQPTGCAHSSWPRCWRPSPPGTG